MDNRNAKYSGQALFFTFLGEPWPVRSPEFF